MPKQALASAFDQGLYALGGFASAAIVGRALGAEDLGAYALGLAWLNALLILVESLVVNPATVLGPAREDWRLPEYFGLQLAAVVCWGFLGTVAGVVVLTFDKGIVLQATGFALLIAPAHLGSQVMRRAPYLSSSIWQSVAGDVVFVGITIVSMLSLQLFDRFTIQTAFISLGLGSAAQLAFMCVIWRPSARGIAKEEFRREVAKQHWGYGKWLLAGDFSSWLAANGYLWLVAVAGTLNDVGGFRAAQTLVNPLTLLFSATALSVLPRLSRSFAENDLMTFNRLVRRISTFLVVCATAFLLISVLAGSQLLVWVFGNELKAYSGYFIALVVGWIPLAWIWGMTAGLQASQDSRAVFLGQSASMASGMVIGFVLGQIVGPIGVIGGLIFGSLVRLFVVNVTFRRMQARAAIASTT